MIKVLCLEITGAGPTLSLRDPTYDELSGWSRPKQRMVDVPPGMMEDYELMQRDQFSAVARQVFMQSVVALPSWYPDRTSIPQSRHIPDRFRSGPIP